MSMCRISPLVPLTPIRRHPSPRKVGARGFRTISPKRVPLRVSAMGLRARPAVYCKRLEFAYLAMISTQKESQGLRPMALTLVARSVSEGVNTRRNKRNSLAYASGYLPIPPKSVPLGLRRRARLGLIDSCDSYVCPHKFLDSGRKNHFL
jgi:hypothetical protein